MRNTRNDLTADYVRKLFIYNPETGKLFWKQTVSKRNKRGGNSRPNKEAGTLQQSGYKIVCINGHSYYVHRIIYLWMTGNWPSDRMDHRFANRSDNRWTLIRPATASENVSNQKISKRNTSGYKGVVWHKNRKYWIAQIVSKRKHHYLGSFKTKQAAHEAYCAAAITLHGDFANPG